MRSRLVSLVLVALAFLCVGVTDASAQFETPNRAFHNNTTFRLDGKHQTVACESCHVNGQYRGTPKNCYDCHWVRRKDDRFQTRLGTQCEQCHRTTSWSAVRWDHAGQAGVPLNADHRQIACESCHRGATFKGASVNCVSCHQKDFAATKSPNHVAAGFPQVCDSCHKPSDASWQSGGPFNHNSVFALVGIHATQACVACHKNNVYKGTPRDCVGCHVANYNGTKSPNHVAAGFSTNCASCHKPTDPGWTQGSPFNHNSIFTLVGVHATVACVACHKNNVYNGTPRDCVGCHVANYNGTRNPNHVTANFPTTCNVCHKPTDASWAQGAGFNHNSVFALVGIHATQACVACHKNNVYKGTPRDCVGCHLANYSATKNPNHVTANFPTTCDSCHKPTDPSWAQGAAFNHNSVFALVGIHATQACVACHVNNVYKGTPRDCVGCHLGNYNGAKNPNHVTANFPTTCDSCHKPTDPSWAQGAAFNHNSVFALVGVHASQACVACHVNNVYKGTSRDCAGCHVAKYNATKTPNHVAAGFSTTCDTCHKPTDPTWNQGVFNHNSVFALVGVHATQACAACHVGNVYKGTSRDCVGCHLANYNATKTPNHVAAGFPTTCDTCHKPTDGTWAQGVFNHTRFPITGRHNVACVQCHTTPNNFAVFSCTVCHARSTTDSAHRGRTGYVYDSNACYSCHPNGRAG